MTTHIMLPFDNQRTLRNSRYLVPNTIFTHKEQSVMLNTKLVSTLKYTLLLFSSTLQRESTLKQELHKCIILGDIIFALLHLLTPTHRTKPKPLWYRSETDTSKMSYTPTLVAYHSPVHCLSGDTWSMVAASIHPGSLEVLLPQPPGGLPPERWWSQLHPPVPWFHRHQQLWSSPAWVHGSSASAQRYPVTGCRYAGCHCREMGPWVSNLAWGIWWLAGSPQQWPKTPCWKDHRCASRRRWWPAHRPSTQPSY